MTFTAQPAARAVTVFLTQHRATPEQVAHLERHGSQVVSLADLVEAGTLPRASFSFRNAGHALELAQACVGEGGRLAAIVTVMPAPMMASFLPLLRARHGQVPVLKALMEPVSLGHAARGNAPRFRWRGGYLELLEVNHSSVLFDVTQLGRQGVVAYSGGHTPDPRVRALLEAQGLTVRILREEVDAGRQSPERLYFRNGYACWESACALVEHGEEMVAIVPVLPFQKMPGLIRAAGEVPVLQFSMRPGTRGQADDGEAGTYHWSGEVRRLLDQTVHMADWVPPAQL